MNLQGKTAVITGASSGIGAATATAMAARGAHVILMARGAAALEVKANEIRAAGGRASVYPVDVSDPAAVAGVAREVQAEVGAVDVVVNNAGIGDWLFIDETTDEDFQQMMAVPAFAAFYVTKAFLPGMVERGSGQITNVNGPGAYAPWPGSTAYAMSRWALRGFSEVLRADLHGTGIKVTSVVMGHVDSPYYENNPSTTARIASLDRLIPTLSEEQAGEIVTKASEQGKHNVFAPAMIRMLINLHRIAPWPLHWLVIKSGASRSSIVLPDDAERQSV